MFTYEFISPNISVEQVEQIITAAKYNARECHYMGSLERIIVQSLVNMDVLKLREAAIELKINVVIIVLSAPAQAAPAAVGATGGMSYQISIQMDPSTVSALMQGGYQLYGFKAVRTTANGASPLVWLSTNRLSTQTAVSWMDEYQAYISNNQIIPNGRIMPMASYGIYPGQTLQVQNGGIGQVINSGTPGAISILNQSMMQFTCGISQFINGMPSPNCALPLYGNFMNVVTPVEKVMLMFSSMSVNTGTVVYQAFRPGLLIDLTSSNSRTVTFDINTGWSWGGYSWGQAVAPNTNLLPLLIQSPYRSADIAVAQEEEQAS